MDEVCATMYINMILNKIFLYGSGWGCQAAYDGLICGLIPIFVCSNDIVISRPVDHYIQDDLRCLSGELIIFAGYKPIVPEYVTSKNICVNIHYSLLPSYRGLHSTVWAILNDEPTLGLSIHLMNKYIDDGDVLYQYEVENDYASTSFQYMQMFNKHISECLFDCVMRYVSGDISPIKQDKRNASWVGKRNLKDCEIDFQKDIKYQKAFFRALVKPYPLPYFYYKQQRLIANKVDFQCSSISTHIGRVLNVDNDGVWVKIKDGYMIISEIIDTDGNIFNNDLIVIGSFLNEHTIP